MSSQQRLTDTVGGALRRPEGWNVIQRIKDAVSSVADDIGVPIDQFTSRPADLPDDAGAMRYQHATIYEFSQKSGSAGPSDPTPIGHVQFRTTFYTLTPPSDEVKRYLRDVNHRRLHTLFNTKTYDGYMDGFNFFNGGIDADHTEEDRPVVADEIPATGLGVPNFSVEVYDSDGDIIGHAKGYSLDFGVEQEHVQAPDAPRGEVWRLGAERASDQRRELRPEGDTPQKDRAKNIAGKDVYVNGIRIGQVVQSRGMAWMSKSRRQDIIDYTGTPHQALQAGTKFYKVRETAGELVFSTKKPQGFTEEDPENIDPEATGLTDKIDSLALVEDDPTTFVVTTDVADDWALGRYDPVVQRDIEYTTDFDTSHGI